MFSISTVSKDTFRFKAASVSARSDSDALDLKDPVDRKKICAAQAKASVTIALSRLAEPWSSVEFTYPAAEPIPGIIVRLRDGTLYAASRICPHQSCQLLYKTDKQEISDTFEVEAGNPVLYVRRAEEAYRRFWRDYCASGGEPAEAK